MRDLHAATCEELVATFAFVFAVDLDERVLQRARPEPPPLPATRPVPAAPPAAPPPSPPDRPRHLTLAAAVLSGVGAGVLPHATPREGLELAAQAGRDGESGLVVSPRLRLGLAFDVPASADTSAQNLQLTASFYALQVRLDACPVAFVGSLVDVSVCARAETSFLFASAPAVTGSRSATDVLFGIGGSARAGFRLSPRWSLGVDGGLVPPFGPDRITALEGRARIFATAPLTGSAQAFAAFRFR